MRPVRGVFIDPVAGIVALVLLYAASVGWAATAEVLRPRVPGDQRVAARAMVNPLRATADNIEAGKVLFYGKAFCSSCHGLEGKGMASIPGLVGALPRDFTDRQWQEARSDGELMWILQNGSPGTDMASFIPLVLTEEEAWQVIMFVRTFGQQ